MLVRTGRIDFPSRENFGPQVLDETVTFPQEIQTFTAGLTGFELKFDNADHEFHRANIDVQGTIINPTTVQVTCVLGLRDDSGDWDDHYSGYVAYAVVAFEQEVPTIELFGFVHSLKTSGTAPIRELLVQLYVPIEEKLLDLVLDISSTEPADLVLTALLRDALALSLPVTCEVVRHGDRNQQQYTLRNVAIKTRKTYHQAGWEVSGGQFRDTGAKEVGTIQGKIARVSVGSYGLLQGTTNDLPDVAQVFVINTENQEEVELFLGLQRADLSTNLSLINMLLTAHREDRDVRLVYYVEPLYPGDTPPVKWILYVQFG